MVLASELYLNPGNLVKNTQATLGSDSVITATTATASGLSIAYTPITSTNDRYIYGYLDWNVNDPDGSAAEGFIELQYSADNSTWSTLETYTRTADYGSGEKMVKDDMSVSGSNAVTTSTTYQTTGVSLAYSPINGSNTRMLHLNANSYTTDNDSGTSNQIALQYSTDNATWSTLREYTNFQASNGATAVYLQNMVTDTFRHIATTNTPYYRIVHRANPSIGAGTSTVFSGAGLVVREMAPQYVINNRSPLSFFVKHNATTSTPYYRIMHRVTSGDQSTIYTGSVLRVMEFSL